MQDNRFWTLLRRFALCLTVFIAAQTACSSIASAQTQGQAQGKVQIFVPLHIVAADGRRHTFQIEVADTDQKRMTGLMYRKSMPFDQGMLFDFGASTAIQMWMKNTYLSLDMLFIRADGTIARIAENTTPLSEEIIPSGEPVLAVLELLGGTSAKLGIKAGDRVEFQLFRR